MNFCVINIPHEDLLKNDFDAQKVIDEKIKEKEVKVEALIYYMKEPDITMNMPNFTKFVETMQNEYQPEISVIFHNSKPTSFDRKTEK